MGAISSWTPRPRPAWVTEMNAVGANPGNPAALVALDEPSLLATAHTITGLDDFGGDEWLEPFRLLVEGLEADARLHLVGRILARADLIRSLVNRLQIT